jgi:hypothetical protein
VMSAPGRAKCAPDEELCGIRWSARLEPAGGKFLLPDTKLLERIIPQTFDRSWERIAKTRPDMSREEHNKAAEYHENAAKAHRAAAEHHGKGDHAKGKEYATSAKQQSQTANQYSDQAHSKSQQQK